MHSSRHHAADPDRRLGGGLGGHARLVASLGYNIWYGPQGALPAWVDALWWVLQAIALVLALFVGWKVWRS